MVGVAVVKQRLARLGQQAAALAARMKRDNVVVKVNATGIRLPGNALAPFWNTAAHLIRNAIDHGLETAEERVAQGKAPDCAIELRASIQGDRLIVEIEDDGRGIAWDKLAERARSMGLPATTRDELATALFCDGVTTREQVTDYSGQGIGMSAVRAACKETGGTVRVWSTPGYGTRFEFSWDTDSLLGASSSARASTPETSAGAGRPQLDGPWQGNPLELGDRGPSLATRPGQ